MSFIFSKAEMAGKTAVLTGMAALGVFMVSCGDSGPIEITEVREVDPENEMVQPVLASTSAERFRYRSKEDSSPGTAAPPSGGGASNLTWETPEGWTEAETTMMRQVNLKFGENGEGECYFTKLSGGGGGLAANVNRWRGQMGLEPMDEKAVLALPAKSLFGKPATFLSLDGTFSGMGAAPMEDYRLLGLIGSDEDSTFFVKMTGPRALVEANSAKFDAFCASLKQQ